MGQTRMGGTWALQSAGQERAGDGEVEILCSVTLSTLSGLA